MGMTERETKRYRYNRENQTNERGDNDEVMIQIKDVSLKETIMEY